MQRDDERDINGAEMGVCDAIGWVWMRLDGNEWVCLNGTGYRLDWIGLGWIGLGWVGLGWVGLGWVGLDWVGFGWVGLGWVGLG